MRLGWAALAVSIAAFAATGSAQAEGAQTVIDQLPLVVTPPARPGTGRMAVLLTGDGGWSGMAKTIAAALAAEGIGVVALDSLKYFWQERTVEETTRDVALIADYYAQQWHAGKIFFVGYSFGADVLPIVLNRLPANVRVRTAGLTLVAPSSVANFEVKVTGWLGVSHAGMPVVPEIERLRGLPMVCMYGGSDEDAVCEALPPGLAGVRKLPGGHHFGGDYAAVAREILPAP